MKLFATILAILISIPLFAAEVPPTLNEQLDLFKEIKSNRFPIPAVTSVPGFEDVCWTESSKWKRINMFHTVNQVNWDEVGPGLLKILSFYERSEECQAAASKFAVIEQTWHVNGPIVGVWPLQGEPQSESTFTFFSRYLFRGQTSLNFYKEDCRFFKREGEEKDFLVCRVINQNASMTPGFVALLTYEKI